MKKFNKKGFTLIEMLVVIAIIAVLVAIIIPVVGSSTTKAAAATDAANLRSIAAEVATDYLDNKTLDKEYKMDSKLKKVDDCVVKSFVKDGEILVYLTTDTNKYYTIEILASIAEDGKDDEATHAPVTTLPTSGEITHTA